MKLWGVLAIAVGCQAASAQALWSGSVAGMSEDAVRAVVPQAQPSPDRDAGKGSTRELLRVPSVEIGKRDCTARFFFTDGKLTSVTLRPEPIGDKGDGQAYYQGLADALRSKYGPESSTSSDRSRYSQTMETRWISGKTVIALTYTFWFTRTTEVEVSYSADIASMAGKL